MSASSNDRMASLMLDVKKLDCDDLARVYYRACIDIIPANKHTVATTAMCGLEAISFFSRCNKEAAGSKGDGGGGQGGGPKTNNDGR